MGSQFRIGSVGLVVGLLAVPLIGCGSSQTNAIFSGSVTPTQTTSRPPTPTPTNPIPGIPVTLTSADSGRTVSVSVGAQIKVNLGAGLGYAWTTPTTSGDAVVKVTSGTTADGGASGTFTAAKAGTANLTAEDNPTCAKPCAPPSVLWQVTFQVTS